MRRGLKTKIDRIIAAISVMSLVLIGVIGLNPNTAMAEDFSDRVPEGYTPIYTVDDLYAINNDLNGQYILMNDLDLSEATAPGGKYDFRGNGWMPIGGGDTYGEGEFNGIFEGNEHTITGLRIDIQEWPSEIVPIQQYAEMGVAINVGLFSYVRNGEISHLTIKDSSIKVGIFTNSNPDLVDISFSVGAICGASGGSIYQCHNYADISVVGSSDSAAKVYPEAVGGITGFNFGSIHECSNAGRIYLYKINLDWGNILSYVGGICGYNQGSFITNSYNCGEVVAEKEITSKAHICAAGISVFGDAKNCYNAGEIVCSQGSAYGIGGLIATNCYTLASSNEYTYPIACEDLTISAIKISNCYFQEGHDWDENGAYSLSESGLKNNDSFSGFDFRSVWTIDAESGYPYPQLKKNLHDDGKPVNPGSSDGEDEDEIEIIEDEKEIVINGISATLKDTIGLNFYISVPIIKDTYTVSFTRNGVVSKIDLSDATQEKIGGIDMYKLEFSVSAKEINDEITISIENADGYSYHFVSSEGDNYGMEYSMSVSRYLNNLAESGDSKTKALANALLDYGNSAQIYFGYHPETVGTVSSAIDAVTVNSFDVSGFEKVGSIPDFDYYGTSLILKDKVTIRHYFVCDTTVDMSKYEFKVNGEVIQIKGNGERYYVDITNITPTKLNDYYTLEVLKEGASVFTIKYSTEVYSYSAVKKTSNDKLVTLVKALHLYSEMTEDFIK